MSNVSLATKGMKLIFLLSIVGTLASCLDNGDETIVLESRVNNTGIPSDSKAEPNPLIGSSTTYVPNFQYTVEKEGDYTVIRLDLTGVQDPETLEWIRLIGTGGTGNSEQNVWVSVDDKPKGISVYNNADDESDREILVDLVFLVDNSGSMNEEADSIAKGIVSWASKLANSNLNVRFGCVGYDGLIRGALNITTSSLLSDYLNKATGTGRTRSFYGDDALILQNAASSYAVSSSQDECGVAALRFADEQFSFRISSNRIYVNFTDEPNQPEGKSQFSVEFLKDQNNWGTSKGAIHTVYSADTIFSERIYYREKPWKMSRYTGGTELYAPYNFKGVSLDKLPVTGAMQNSYIIRFTNIEEFMDGKPHTVKITILSVEGRVRAEKVFTIVFGYKSEN